MSLINSLPDAKSREIALAITTPIEPVKPCKNLATSKISILGAIAQSILAMTHRILPMMSGFFRPNESLRGPPIN